jgi:streptomycin 6-kinase
MGRLHELAARWSITLHDVKTTSGSLVGFGTRAAEEVVLKAVRSPGDEWLSGRTTEAFGGHGMVTVLEWLPGAVLMERLRPATTLSEIVDSGRDEDASRIAAGVIRRMREVSPVLDAVPTAAHLGRAFDTWLRSGDRQLSVALVEQAADRFDRLCQTQRDVRLLHGDLQHYNIVYDEQRGWTAIDPKGVVAEMEFEIGTLLRNPCGHPELYSEATVVERRIVLLAAELALDATRIVEWSFAQAVLSAIWTIEDHGIIDPADAALCLAKTVQELLC